MNNILSYYVNLVEFLGQVLGENCEVVLQDCSKRNHSIVAIANNHISGRAIGAPLTNYGLKIIADEKWKTVNWEANYAGRTADGKALRCSTYFIKEKDELVGMLCFNYDPSIYQNLSNELLKLGGLNLPGMDVHPDKKDAVESFYQSIPEMVQTAAREIIGSTHDVDITRLNQAERLAILEQLDKKGVFQVKGAVSEIASIFQCSEASIYRYLSKINKKRGSVSSLGK